MKRMQASEPSAKSAVGKRTRVRINNLLDRNGQFRGAGFPDEIEPFVEARDGLCGDFQDARSGWFLVNDPAHDRPLWVSPAHLEAFVRQVNLDIDGTTLGSTVYVA